MEPTAQERRDACDRLRASLNALIERRRETFITAASSVINEVASDVEAMLREIAPEIPNAYLMKHHGIGKAISVSAYTFTNYFPEGWQALLRAQGRWAGDGVLMALVPESMADDDDSPDVDAIRQRIFAIGFHELAHNLPWKPHSNAGDSLCLPGLQGADAAYWAYLEFQDVGAPQFEPLTRPWLNHGADFIRTMAHIHHRAEQHGFIATDDQLLFAGDNYELSDPNEYIARLGDEPARMASATFAEIAATEPPKKFTELFAADCEAWLQAQVVER